RDIRDLLAFPTRRSSDLMYKGDRSRKENLVNYGFRLPSALDNRPLKFDEFEAIAPQRIYVSATPAAYELEHSADEVVEQVVRPTDRKSTRLNSSHVKISY